MTNKTLSAQIEQLISNLDSQEEVSEATRLLHKRFFEKSLNAELDDHLGYAKHTSSKHTNSRNGSTGKTVYTDDGVLDIATPRDRDGRYTVQFTVSYLINTIFKSANI